jgi:hypothetical protein
MPKRQPISTEEAEELMGGGSLLDRIGRGTPVIEQPSTEQKSGEEGEKSATAKPIKVSLYLYPDEVNALDTQIIKRRKETGHSPRRTHLIREAIHAWLKQQS